MATTWTFTLRSGVVLSDANITVEGAPFDVDQALVDGDGEIATTDSDLAAALTALRVSDGLLFDVVFDDDATGAGVFVHWPTMDIVYDPDEEAYPARPVALADGYARYRAGPTVPEDWTEGDLWTRPVRS